jgi:hypothetical protein
MRVAAPVYPAGIRARDVRALRSIRRAVSHAWEGFS